MQRYEKYKDSGIEWLGEIPEHWEDRKLGNILRPYSIKNRADLPLLSITREKGVIQRGEDPEEDNHNFIPDDLSGYKHLKIGQFGMNKMKAWQGSYGYSHFEGIVSPAYYIFDISSKLFGEYFSKTIRSKAYIPFFAKASDGVRIGQWDLSKQRMKEIPFYVPPLNEQEAINKFLDDKCEKIDAAVNLKEQQIEKLKELRQITIHNAVTQGIPHSNDEGAKMKDSGIGWIGKIPQHWEVRRLASLGFFSKGGGFSKADLVEEDGEPAILYGDIYTKYNYKILSPIRLISREASSQAVKLDRNDLLFTGSGELKEDIGKCVAFKSRLTTFAGGDVIIFKQRKNSSEYLSFCMNTNGAKYEKAKSSKGEIIVHTYASKLREIYIPIPPYHEQKEIVAYLEEQTSKIDKAIAQKQEQIIKLKEYKQSLINEVVTGKLKVTE
ncbi:MULTISPECIES: restriction endonuclease subunit S [Sphingobacterium]|uniref:restriction endonuclease subunit S n=1 Tax=Sphingobacterium TaxID=28453 RepID=UPI00129CD8C5|nr:MULTISPECIES: restriction endonuclease subunit S [Sphingobacterium]